MIINELNHIAHTSYIMLDNLHVFKHQEEKKKKNLWVRVFFGQIHWSFNRP